MQYCFYKVSNLANHLECFLEKMLLCCSDFVYLSFHIVNNWISVINFNVIQMVLKLFAFGSINFVGPLNFCFYCNLDLYNLLLLYSHRFSFQLIYNFGFSGHQYFLFSEITFQPVELFEYIIKCSKRQIRVALLAYK